MVCGMLRGLALFLVLLSFSAPLRAKEAPVGQCVVILPYVVEYNVPVDMIEMLSDAGYRGVALEYPENIKSAANMVKYFVDERVKKTCNNPLSPIHFITFGMSGAILNQYIYDFEPVNIGNVVFIDPLPQHSALMNPTLRNHPVYIDYFKRKKRNAYQEVMMADIRQPLQTPYGVITIERSTLKKEKNKRSIKQGVISVSKNEIKMAGRLLDPGRNQSVIDHTLYFLKHGEFDAEEE